ncbi:hypothetical protein ACFL0W_05195, partial [Nanoarchaeota archaeon]
FVCGNDFVDDGEECDGVDLEGMTCGAFGYDGGSLSCNPDCTYSKASCFSTVEVCGDGIVQQPNDAYIEEECDGSNFNGMSCSDFDGYTSGTLACTGSCTFDTSTCLDGTFVCGDGVVNQIDEDCDTDDLDGATCISFGFDDGVLNCDGSCSYDKSGCIGGVEVCGDNIIQTPNGASFNEQCDGTSLNSMTCQQFDDYTLGILSCAGDCTFDYAGCNKCGNAILDIGEQCDLGSDNNGAPRTGCSATCQYVSVPGPNCEEGQEICFDGTCSLNCGYTDTSVNCDGNGVCDNGEGCSCNDCDTEQDSCASGLLCSVIAGACCDLMGDDYCDPYLGCFNVDPDCGICGDGDVNYGEECDDGNTDDGDGCSSSCQFQSAPPDCEQGLTICFDGTCSLNCPVTDTGYLCDGDGQCEENEGCTCNDCANESDTCDSGLVCSITAQACCDITGDGYCPQYTTCVSVDPDCDYSADCGDGDVEYEEQCDDGNIINGDGCDSNCEFEIIIGLCPPGSTRCSDGTCSQNCDVTDDGTTCNNDGTCDDNEGCDCADCDGLPSGCGQGLVCSITAQTCCDITGDGSCDEFSVCVSVDPDCEEGVCGDGDINLGEECDDGNTANDDGCDSNCDFEIIPGPFCPETLELCSDGTCSLNCAQTDDGTTCNTDGTCDPGEGCGCSDCDDDTGSCEGDLVCDIISGSCCDKKGDGNCNPFSVCVAVDPDCNLAGFCGDGTLDYGEQCDDGDTDNDDGCSASCLFEVVDPPCPTTLTLCADNTCSQNCDETDGGTTCDNNGVCDSAEGCVCADCDNQTDTCESGLTCSLVVGGCCDLSGDGDCDSDSDCSNVDPDCDPSCDPTTDPTCQEELPDTDGDGMNDYCEISYGFDPLNPDENLDEIPDGFEDPDNDGLTNQEECELGTDPNVCDSDGDGICDGGEQNSDTDPTNESDTPTDLDGDGMDDAWEDLYECVNSSIPDGHLDPDNDNLTNVQEYHQATHPCIADTDGDGLLDGEEVYDYHTNPNKQDTDGDGFTDKEEIDAGTDPLDPNDYPGAPPTPTPTPIPTPEPIEEKSIIPLILLILSILMLLGSASYLIYQRYSPPALAARAKAAAGPSAPGRPGAPGAPRPGMPRQPTPQELMQQRAAADVKRRREEIIKRRRGLLDKKHEKRAVEKVEEREKLFSAFGGKPPERAGKAGAKAAVAGRPGAGKAAPSKVTEWVSMDELSEKAKGGKPGAAKKPSKKAAEEFDKLAALGVGGKKAKGKPAAKPGAKPKDHFDALENLTKARAAKAAGKPRKPSDKKPARPSDEFGGLEKLTSRKPGQGPLRAAKKSAKQVKPDLEGLEKVKDYQPKKGGKAPRKSTKLKRLKEKSEFEDIITNVEKKRGISKKKEKEILKKAAKQKAKKGKETKEKLTLITGAAKKPGKKEISDLLDVSEGKKPAISKISKKPKPAAAKAKKPGKGEETLKKLPTKGKAKKAETAEDEDLAALDNLTKKRKVKDIFGDLEKFSKEAKEEKAKQAAAGIEDISDTKSKTQLVNSLVDMSKKKDFSINTFKTLLVTLVSLKKITQHDVVDVAFELNKKDVLTKKQLSDLFFAMNMKAEAEKVKNEDVKETKEKQKTKPNKKS